MNEEIVGVMITTSRNEATTPFKLESNADSVSANQMDTFTSQEERHSTETQIKTKQTQKSTQLHRLSIIVRVQIEAQLIEELSRIDNEEECESPL